MTAFANLSFENASATFGVPASWVLNDQPGTVRYAEFLNADVGTVKRSFEAFEGGWSNSSALFAFAPGDLSTFAPTTHIVTGKSVENFEELWTNDDFQFELALRTEVTFPGAFITRVDSSDTPVTGADFVQDEIAVSPIANVGRAKVRATLSTTAIVINGHGIDVMVGLGDSATLATTGDITASPVTVEYDVGNYLSFLPVEGSWFLSYYNNFGFSGGDETIETWSLSFYGADTAYESFESAWPGTDDFAHTIAEAGSVGTTFVPDSTTAEEFESGWNDNEDFEFVMGSNTAANFNNESGATTYNGFEFPYTPLAITGTDTSTNVMTFGAAHGFIAGSAVQFVRGDGALPFPLVEGRDYLVDAAGLTSTAFKVKDVSSGVVVDLTTTGDGTNYMIGAPTYYWGAPDTF